MLAHAGVPAAEAPAAGDLLEDGKPLPLLVLHDVSPPRSFHDAVEAVHGSRRAAGGRCPVAIMGSQSPSQLSILARACQAAAWIAWSDDPLVFVRAVRRILSEHRTRPAVDEWTAPSERELSPRTARPSWGIVKLLLIDDSEIALALMQERLRVAGFDVRIALALQEVHAIVRGWSPNVIVVDVNMPEIRGDALCAQLKAQVGQDVLIVLCSNMPPEELAPIAAAAGADGYVSKAHGLDGFVDLVSSWCRRLSDPIVSIQ